MVYLRMGLEGYEVRARDLSTGADRVLQRDGQRRTGLEALDPMWSPRVQLSPDGETIAFNPSSVEHETVINLISWTTGEQKKLCDSCGLIYKWTPDGQRILYRSGKPMRFWDVHFVTGKQRLVASDPSRAVAALMPSPDGQWFAIHYATSENVRPLFIAHAQDGIAAPRPEWIPAIDRPGFHQRPWWSQDGQTLYFLSDRNGSFSIWGQRLEPATKRPIGEPFLVFTPPNERLAIAARPMFGPASRTDSLIFEMTEGKSNVWIGE